MKHYKFIILSISILLIGSIFITSCQQEVLTDENVLSQDLFESDETRVASEAYVLPKGLESKTPEHIISYIENLSDDKRKELMENYRIKAFLQIEGIYTSVYNQLEEGGLFINIDLESYLTAEQLNHLSEFSLDSAISSRCCDYPMYNYHNPDWCGTKRHKATNCNPYNWYCGNTHMSNSNAPGETVKEQYCGYPHGELVRWHLYTCHSVCP